MVKILVGRYLLFGVLGVETLLLPFFLSKEMYGELEFYKSSVFLMQFALFGAGTGYVVRYFKTPAEDKERLTSTFHHGALVHAILVGFLMLFIQGWVLALLSVFSIMAMAYESILKTKEKYLMAMSFKPLLSLSFIFLVPALLAHFFKLETYVLVGFIIAMFLYRFMIHSVLDPRFSLGKVRGLSQLSEYACNVKAGFVLNASTAVMFLFFYIDRTLIKNNYPDLLADYSLSFAIMQLTAVGITTFSYVNLVEFGKGQENEDIEVLMGKVRKALNRCFLIYIPMGLCTIIFSFFAEAFYSYKSVFETTSLMVVLYGLAIVCSSINAAHLYLGTTNVMLISILVSLVVSILLNSIVPFSHEGGYYILLTKTYGLYLLFSVFSALYVIYKLGLSGNHPLRN